MIANLLASFYASNYTTFFFGRINIISVVIQLRPPLYHRRYNGLKIDEIQAEN